MVVGRLCLKAILMSSATREEKILGTRRRAHLHYGRWRQRQVHCGSWRQSQHLFPRCTGLCTVESLSLGSLWDRFLLGVGGFCVYVFPGWILVRLPTGLSTGLHLTSAEGQWLFQFTIIASTPPLVFLLPHPNRDFPSDWFSLASNKLPNS